MARKPFGSPSCPRKGSKAMRAHFKWSHKHGHSDTDKAGGRRCVTKTLNLDPSLDPHAYKHYNLVFILTSCSHLINSTDCFVFLCVDYINLLNVNIYNLPWFSPILAFINNNSKYTKNPKRPWKHQMLCSTLRASPHLSRKLVPSSVC